MSNENSVAKKEEQLTRNLRGRVVVTPPVDIFENDEEYLLVADIPGVPVEGLDVRLDKGELSIEARWSSENGEQRALGREYQPTDYRRSFVVPDTVDPAGVSADLADGVLAVHLPKSEALRPRSIQIRTA